MSFKITETKIKDLLIIEPQVFGDERGFFMETYNKREFNNAGITTEFVQDNHSRSRRGVLRGLHFQRNYPQGKLVRVTSGEVFDVAVDIRSGSPTYGEWFGVILNDENKVLFYIPEGFAHGFLVLSETADFSYKCTRLYDPSDEDGIMWNDSDIGINWFDNKHSQSMPTVNPLDVILSDKDKTNGNFKQFTSPYQYN
jgi:dTDP-4-dehydrorhamnose 3,5-epimerase